MTHRLQGVTCRVDEEQANVDTRVDNVTITHRRELLSEVRRMLVFDLSMSAKVGMRRKGTDVLDDRVPAAFVVDQVAIAWSVDNVQTELNAVLDNHCARTLVALIKMKAITHHGSRLGSQLSVWAPLRPQDGPWCLPSGMRTEC